MSAKKQPKKSAKKTRKPKLETMSQTHGKVEEPDSPPTTLDQIWGDDGSHKYNTLNERAYRDSLSKMSLTDLQSHSQKLGLVPVDNREMLTGRLMREFRTHVQKYQAPPQPVQPTEYDEKVYQILKEGQ